MQLTRREKSELRLETSRKPYSKVPPDPKYVGIHQYECGVCGEKKYYRPEDEDMPQYHTKRRMTKLGYGIGIAVCHECFHEEGYENKVVRHSSGCRVCELAYYARLARRRAKVEAKLRQEARAAKSAKNGFIKQVPDYGEQKRSSSSVLVPKRRKHHKDVQVQRSGGRRSSRV